MIAHFFGRATGFFENIPQEKNLPSIDEAVALLKTRSLSLCETGVVKQGGKSAEQLLINFVDYGYETFNPYNASNCMLRISQAERNQEPGAALSIAFLETLSVRPMRIINRTGNVRCVKVLHVEHAAVEQSFKGLKIAEDVLRILASHVRWVASDIEAITFDLGRYGTEMAPATRNKIADARENVLKAVGAIKVEKRREREDVPIVSAIWLKRNW